MLAACSVRLQADPMAAVTGWTGSGWAMANQPIYLGWTFSLSGPISVSALGIYDMNNDGIGGHNVMIQRYSDAVVMASTTVNGSGTLSNGFRYVSIPAVELVAGTYTVAAYYEEFDADYYLQYVSNPVTSSPVSYVGPYSSVSVYGATTGIFGPNFLFGPVSQAVPEPGTYLLVAAGGVALLVRRRLNA